MASLFVYTKFNLQLQSCNYQLKLNEKNEMIWLEHQKDGRSIQHSHDPETTKFQRFMMNLVTKFPGEWLM